MDNTLMIQYYRKLSGTCETINGYKVILKNAEVEKTVQEGGPTKTKTKPLLVKVGHRSKAAL